jgi:hypothetical protein
LGNPSTPKAGAADVSPTVKTQGSKRFFFEKKNQKTFGN